MVYVAVAVLWLTVEAAVRVLEARHSDPAASEHEATPRPASPAVG